jgi:hypothetical protein
MDNKKQFFDMIPDYQRNNLSGADKSIFEKELKINKELQVKLSVYLYVDKTIENWPVEASIRNMYANLETKGKLTTKKQLSQKEPKVIEFTPTFTPNEKIMDTDTTSTEQKPFTPRRQNPFFQYYARIAAAVLPFLVAGGLWLNNTRLLQIANAQKQSDEAIIQFQASSQEKIAQVLYQSLETILENQKVAMKVKGNGEGETLLEEYYKALLDSNINNKEAIITVLKMEKYARENRESLTVNDKKKLALANLKIGKLDRGKEILKEILPQLDDVNKQQIQDILNIIEK